MKIKKMFTIWVSILLIVAILVPFIGYGASLEEESEDATDSQTSLRSNEETTSNYETHDPIKINNNTDLDNTAEDEGWPGDGSESDPYLIEGYDIDGYDTDGDPTGYAIYIGNTTDHFIVRDCKLHDAEDSLEEKNAGMHIFNVTNGKIENNEITSNEEYGIYMEDSFNNSINNNTVSSGAYSHDGIYFSNSDDNVLKNNTVDSNGDYGIYLDHSDGNILENNSFSDNSYEGIYLSNSDYTHMENNTISSNNDEGIYIYSSDYTNIKNNTISSNNDEGIYIYSSDYTNMENNTISSNDDYGLYISYSQGATLKNNEMMYDGILVRGSFTDWTTLDIDLSNTVNGNPVRLWKNRTSGTVPTDTGQVILANCTGVSVEDQDISQSSVGILVGVSDNITIYNNTLSDNDDGLYLDDSTDISSMNNSAIGNRKGFYLDNTENSNFENNTLTSNTDDGMYTSYSDSNMFRNNNLSSNYDGIELYSSYGNTLVNNSFYSNNKYGIYTSYSDSNVLKNNTVSFSDNYGIYFSSSEDISMENTTMIEDGVMIKGSSISHWNTHDIDLSNTVNGKPVRYWKDKTSGDMPSDTGQVILANCAGVTVEDKKYDNSSVGILLGHSDENHIKNNTLRSNDEGIYVYYSENNVIENNTAVSNRNGIKLDHSYFNNLTNNSIYSNTDNGIYLYSSESNTLENNGIHPNNNDGIYMDSSNSNDLLHNNISSNDDDGIYLYSSSDNSIENNTIDSNNDGIYLSYSHDNSIENNTIDSNNDEGVYFYSSDYNSIENNTIDSNGDEGVYISSSDDNSIENNSISLNGGEGIYFSSSGTNTLRNNTISLNYNGIYMYRSNSNHMIDNGISSNNRDGMHIRDSGSNTLENNTLTNHTYEGIYLYSSSNNLMIENTVSSNSEEGIYLSTSDNNDIENNSISLNGYFGIYVSDSSLNILNNNTVLENSDYGIYLNSNTDNTTIYHNNIIDNSGQGLDHGEDNRWYSDTLQEGNYWSDYNGTDSDDDGIGDTNYTISGSAGSNDTYPLIYAVNDDEPPSLDADNSPSTGAAGGEYTFEIEASDDLAVGSVNASWSHDSLSGNKVLSEEDEGTWTGTITLDMSSNNLTYRIQVNDSACNYVRGDEKEISVIIDTDGPTINDTTSRTPTTGDAFNVTAGISDNTKVDTVWLNYTLTDVDGYSNTFNRSMNPEYWYELSIWNNATDLDYDVLANDTVDNWNSSSSSYSVTDNEDPSMDDRSPDFGYKSEDFNFKVSATDNIGVESVNVSWSHGSLSGNVPLSDADDDDVWEGTITLDNSTDDLSYRVQVNDTSDNYALSSVLSVSVVDSDKPLRIDNSADLAQEASSGSGLETDPYIIEGLEIDGYGKGYGIYIGNTTDHFVLKNNTIYGASGNTDQYFKNSGIYLYNVTNGSVKDNTIYDNDENGMILESSSENVIKNNSVSENRHGIHVLDSSSGNLINDNNASSNGMFGIYIENSDDNTVRNNDAYDNYYSGIMIEASENNTIEKSTIRGSRGFGLYVRNSDNNTLIENYVSEIGYYGIYLRGSDNNTLTRNHVSMIEYYGIYLENSHNNTLTENRVSEIEQYGIYLEGSDNNTLTENHVSEIGQSGIYLEGSDNNTLTENHVSEIADYGIYLESSRDNIVKGNNATSSMLGFLLEYSEENVLLNNSAYENRYGLGFSRSESNSIESNNFSFNEFGIYSGSSLDNSISKNTISSNTKYGLYFRSGTGNNLIYHNNICNNTQQAFDDGTDNQWYNATLQEGNYWSDYTGTDQDGDGVGETNYTNIGGGAGSNDSYPLTVPVNDNDPPSLDADNSPGSGTTGDLYKFNITASDNFEVGSVNVSWAHGSRSGNIALTYDGNGTWSGTITLDDSLSDMVYKVQVNDTSGNYIRGSEQTLALSDNDAPIADAGEDKTVYEDTVVTFDGSGSSDNLGIVNYTWTIEGSEYYGMTVDHTFVQPGEYTVELNVTDDAGNWGTDTLTVTVNLVTDPTADAGENKTVAVNEVFELNATGSMDDLGINNYTWTIEGTEVYGEEVTHSFDSSGRYVITLKVTDKHGNFDTDTVNITVVTSYFEVEITDYDENVAPGDHVMIEATIENTGEANGTQNITFSVEGSAEDRKEFTIEAGENETVKFFWEAEPGSYRFTVASEDDEDRVAVNDIIEDIALPGFTSHLLVLAAIFAVAIYHKKKRRRSL